MTGTDPTTALDVADWRRRVHELYRTVRSDDDPARAHANWRRGRDRLFAEHPATPLLAEQRDGFSGLPVAPYDERYRWEVALQPAEPDTPDEFSASTSTDGTVPYRRIGVVALATPGGEVRLDVWWLASYGGGLFVPVRDAAPNTYGGGRYLLDTIKGADLGASRDASGRTTLVLDLNFAYNPSCAYDPAWACPLAPAGNTTQVALPVGERYP
ncbi:DUF1684 domain-containing protein [Angustibacter sp. McL0619]|uniref:DUF1684 domain-containing protein n=1 Tax=Angustibacter sp. McL0619 TaxID=3415676 RepID=UPI003CEA1CE0